VSQSIKEYERNRDAELARELAMNWSPQPPAPATQNAPVSVDVYKAILRDVPEPMATSLEAPNVSRAGSGTQSASMTTTSNSGAQSASSAELREKCESLEKEREDKDKLITTLLEQLEVERAAHADLKRGVAALGEQLASVDKLVYTMDDELTAVYELLANSKVVRKGD
jgi:hypothetical protein